MDHALVRHGILLHRSIELLSDEHERAAVRVDEVLGNDAVDRITGVKPSQQICPRRAVRVEIVDDIAAVAVDEVAGDEPQFERVAYLIGAVSALGKIGRFDHVRAITDQMHL